MLLQIAEPGQSLAPHQHKRAVGIDLGTTNSLVAAVRSGHCSPLTDKSCDAILPSIVHYDLKDIIVGTKAAKLAKDFPAQTISSVKRLIGRSLDDILKRYPNMPYQLHSSEQNLPLIETPQGKVNPIQVSSEILKALAMRAQDALGGELDGVVITVPAYFDDAQRAGTKDAAKLAGLHVLRLLNEPTAAAIAYGLDSKQEGVIAVYDLGGGTFDVSILRLSKGVFEVLATGGDSALGGDDFDELLATFIQQELALSDLTPSQYRALIQIATQAKIDLSTQAQVSIEFMSHTLVITRAQLNQLIRPLVKKTLLACRRAMKDAQVQLDEVEAVVMVGGSTRTPLVCDMVGEYFNQPPLTSINPDEVVAIGAGIQADILVGNKPDSQMLLLDVIPLSLGIETMGGLVEKIIPRNTTIPVARAQEFTTFKDGQTAMLVHVLQGERELVTDCRSLAKFTLKGIPAMNAGAAHIRVTYQVDADGLLSVTAMEKSTGVQADIQVKPSYGLSDDEIANMLKDSMTYAKDDMHMRALMEQRVEADRVLEGLAAALAENGAQLLSNQEYTQITDSMQALKIARDKEDAQQITLAIKETDKVSQSFASRRMDVSIRQALAGQDIDKI